MGGGGVCGRGEGGCFFQYAFFTIKKCTSTSFMIFFNTDGWTHKLHTKQITPLPYMGTGGNF